MRHHLPPAKKMVGGTALAAASDGNQVVAASGSRLDFQLARPLTLTILQSATATK